MHTVLMRVSRKPVHCSTQKIQLETQNCSDKGSPVDESRYVTHVARTLNLLLIMAEPFTGDFETMHILYKLIAYVNASKLNMSTLVD